MSNFTSPGSVSRNSCNPSRNNAELTGTYTPFRPFLQVAVESDEIDPNNTNVQVEEVRYQTITMLPEYRNKSLEELRFEDFIAKRYKVRQVGISELSFMKFHRINGRPNSIRGYFQSCH